jgi:tetratricopeptide (TPR) repeat protein
MAYYNLGNALRDQGKVEEGIAAYRKAIELDPKHASAHNNLGITLHAQRKLDEAIDAFHKAMQADPKYGRAHYNLGLVLRDQRKLDEAIAAFRKAIELDPSYARAHYDLGLALQTQRNLDEAISAYQETIRLKKDYAEAHCNLGLALQERGRFMEALASLRRGHELGSKNPNWGYSSAEWIKHCERLIELDAQLPAVLKGEVRAKDLKEQFEFAQLCGNKKLHVAAARLYLEMLNADPKRNGILVAAASAAVLAGCGQGEDADGLDDSERARWRKQALDWLRADLVEWSKLLKSTSPQTREAALRHLRNLPKSPTFAVVRETAPLSKLPEAEREAWQRYWADLDSVLRETQSSLRNSTTDDEQSGW